MSPRSSPAANVLPTGARGERQVLADASGIAIDGPGELEAHRAGQREPGHIERHHHPRQSRESGLPSTRRCSWTTLEDRSPVGVGR